VSVDVATGGDLLERYARAWSDFDGDAWVDLFAEEAEYHPDPFSTPLVGHNALRAYLLQAAADEEQVDFTIERHWVAGDTVLAAWHESHVRQSNRERVRSAGFLTMEVGPGGPIKRLHRWPVTPGAV
jgi:ketosteroid isomerase-like protein